MRVATQNQAASRPYRTPELTHIRELDGVRGLAALLVSFIMHLSRQGIGIALRPLP